MDTRPHVVIIGGGFGGLNAALYLRKAPVRVTLIDRRNFHLFQPLLYQVATGGLSPANIATPLRALFKRLPATEVLLAEVRDIDLAGRRVHCDDRTLAYDTLIVATGSGNHYFGHPEWAERAPSLKTIEDATDIRRRILLAFEHAELATDPKTVDQWLTFVLVGGGPTGVELAGALSELAHHTLRQNFRHIQPNKARILLIEGTERILPTYPPDLSEKAAQSLARLGATVRTGALVTDVGPDSVTVKAGETTERIPARTVLWTAGVLASPLARRLGEASGAAVDRAGRVSVGPDCSLPGHPEVFVIGDMADFKDENGKPLPGVAPVAIQQGRYVARLIRERLRGRTLPPFHYKDRGSVAVIGRAAAVADLGWIHISGYLAWLAWLVIHIMNLILFENRLLVMVQWAWDYATRNRAARLITGPMPAPGEGAQNQHSSS
ncbi:MAG TPA: NAD(P)/FAD-dependent oxidoreductase [Gemmataceae bacterium]|nr:NAD(P)/FAD-dependent oxidoreductase [Gemmataceae bacterium]